MAAGVNIRLTWRQFVLKACILAFLISIPMTWYELYKAAEIQQQTAAMKDAPPECVRDKEDLDESTFDTLLGVAQSAFRGLFTFEKDNCQKYYEHMLISPFLKVPPTKVGKVEVLHTKVRGVEFLSTKEGEVDIISTKVMEVEVLSTKEGELKAISIEVREAEVLSTKEGKVEVLFTK
ncbi:Chloride channel CLIC-like protein 1 [Mizuhopecten yessoensis]|uniref:Chloride channel CLIC-like protein 1 n=1 Tax=Mizuhopecten yessoensis TaxID=6573 RepID=A0A210QMA1_MIZYE|nr:Chloride channel CLIC-like protein 1 [Mizuhopecten yessoensis]